LQGRVARPLLQKLPRPLEGGVGFGEAVVDPVGIAQLGEGAGAKVGDEPRPWILLRPDVLGHSRGAVRQIEHPLRIAEAQLVALPQQRLTQGPAVERLDLPPRKPRIPEPARRLIEQGESLLELRGFFSPTLEERRRAGLDAADGLLVALIRHLRRRHPGLLSQERRCQSLHAPPTERTAGQQVKDNPAAIGRLQPAREEALDLSLPEMNHQKTPPYGTQITRALQDFLTKDTSEKPPGNGQPLAAPGETRRLRVADQRPRLGATREPSSVRPPILNAGRALDALGQPLGSIVELSSPHFFETTVGCGPTPSQARTRGRKLLVISHASPKPPQGAAPAGAARAMA